MSLRLERPASCQSDTAFDLTAELLDQIDYRERMRICWLVIPKKLVIGT